MNILRNIVMIVFCSGSLVFSQTMDKNDRQSNATDQSNSQTINSQFPTGTIIQDGPVDPMEYIIGPGDIFSVSIWSAVPLMFQVPVSPEGTVVIPTVTEIRITGMTLDSAKKRVMSEIRKKYITGTASFTLFFPRSFTVTVLGAVLNEGTVVVKSTQRIDAAFLLANDVQKYREQTGANIQDPKVAKEIQKKMNSGSRRNIVINRKNGNIVKADIEKYLISHNPLYNPLLLDGDIIIFQPKNIDMDYVAIYGAIGKEGIYEYVDGDSISLLVRMGGGLTVLADSGKGFLYRITESGKQEKIDLDILKILAHQSPDVPLRRGDRLIVKNKSFLEQGGVVVVEGEVVMPGSYPIIRDSTTLSQVITMAGGFTSFASMTSSMIFRNKNAMQIERDTIILKRGLTSLEDVEYLRREIAINSISTQVQADFHDIFVNGELKKDVKLKDGDKIVISSKVKTVYIFGEVKSPGFVSFLPDKDANYYITKSGGLTVHAVESDIKVIKASSKQWLSPDETTIEEGDYIWVPKIPFRPITYYLTIYSQVFGIIGTVATLYLLITK